MRVTAGDAIPLYFAYAATRKKPSTPAGDRARLAALAEATGAVGSPAASSLPPK
jgi:hypothetical protein